MNDVSGDTPQASEGPPPYLERKQSAEIHELATALAKAQGQMTFAAKTEANTFFKSKYADLAACWEAVRKPLSDNGLAVLQFPSAGYEYIDVETMLVHSSGQWVSQTLRLPVSRDKDGHINAQGTGSAITYARRYGLSAVVGIAPDDDDGEAAVGRPQQRPNATPRPQGDTAATLYDRLAAEARKGLPAYERAFKGLTTPQRELLGREGHMELKQIAMNVKGGAQ